jgi:hypothetical protein
MPAREDVDSAPSLLGITVRRSVVLGRIYLGLGTGYGLLFAVLTSLVAGNAFAATIALFLPLFAVLGSLGGLIVFTNDRVKGVFEYLVAYGVSPRRLFVNVLVTSVLLTTIVLGIVLSAGLSVFVATGHAITGDLVVPLVAYSVPMAYASVLFAATVGMYWTSLSSPREGMSNPVGLMPIVGIAPGIVTVIVAGVAGSLGVSVYAVTSSAVALVAAIVLLLLASTERLMPPERLLSPV